jgi:hypothetical protein
MCGCVGVWMRGAGDTEEHSESVRCLKVVINQVRVYKCMRVWVYGCISV